VPWRPGPRARGLCADRYDRLRLWSSRRAAALASHRSGRVQLAARVHGGLRSEASEHDPSRRRPVGAFAEGKARQAPRSPGARMGCESRSASRARTRACGPMRWSSHTSDNCQGPCTPHRPRTDGRCAAGRLASARRHRYSEWPACHSDTATTVLAFSPFLRRASNQLRGFLTAPCVSSSRRASCD